MIKIKNIFKKKPNLTGIDLIKYQYTEGNKAKIYGKVKHPLRDKLRNYLNTIEADSVFEFGCNAGYNLQPLKAKIKHGIDINKKAIEYGRKNLHLEIELHDERFLKYIVSQSYDLVFTSSVLNHIPEENFKQILNELKRICKHHLICLETNDHVDESYFSHDYSEFKIKWEFLSTIKSGGNGCVYNCYYLDMKKQRDETNDSS